MIKKLIIPVFTLLTILSCIRDDDYNIPTISCIESNLKATKTIQEIFDASTIEASFYETADVIEAYVISNDQKGNFYKVLYLQSLDGRIGLSIPLDVEHLYTVYNPGRKVLINLKGLHIQIKDGGLLLGNLINTEISRISRSNYKNVIIPSCEVIDTSQIFKNLSLNEIKDNHLNTLVQLKDVQFEEVAIGRTLYDTNKDAGGGTNYNIIDISGTQIRLRTHSFADYGGSMVPDGNGSIKGVLTKFGVHYQILPRSYEDLELASTRKRIGFAETISGSKISIAEIRSLFKGNDLKLKDDNYIEGVITMSGIANNNLSNRMVFIQDETGGIALRCSNITSLIRSQKVKVHLKDIVLNSDRGLLQANVVQWEDLFFVDDKVDLPPPILVKIADLFEGKYQGQLIAIEDLQFDPEIGKFKGSQLLTDCKENIELFTLTTASFAKQNYPNSKGKITAIASTIDLPVLIIRDSLDVKDMIKERCIPKGDLTNKIFFSELADPDNNSKARFIELFNASEKIIDLTGWKIKRYTNENTESTALIDLTGSKINSKQAFVIAIDADEFQKVYGIIPDLIGATNGPAGSNGDDNMQLIDPDGLIIDSFGIPGEDGSGTTHEFEDGRAYRKIEIVQGKPIFTFSEWLIFNDTGAMGTIRSPQNAPQDFTPGLR